MIRVWTTNESEGTMITVEMSEGGYSHEIEACIAEVEARCDEAISQKRPVHLLLRDVPTISEWGRMLLSRLAAKGVELSASGVYNRYIVGEIRSEAGAEPKSRHGWPETTRNSGT